MIATSIANSTQFYQSLATPLIFTPHTRYYPRRKKIIPYTLHTDPHIRFFFFFSPLSFFKDYEP